MLVRFIKMLINSEAAAEEKLSGTDEAFLENADILFTLYEDGL